MRKMRAFDEDDLNQIQEHTTGCGTDKRMCEKSPTKFPERTWVISKAGTADAMDLREECQKRDQDLFGIHIYNNFRVMSFRTPRRTS